MEIGIKEFIKPKEKEKKPYNIFKQRAPTIQYIAASAVIFLIGFFIAWVFYKVVLASIIVGLLSLFFLKVYEKKRLEKLKKEIEDEFYDLNQLLIAELETGIPINSALKNIESRLGNNTVYNFKYMEKEIRKWVRAMETGKRIESIIRQFAEDSEDNNIKEYANLVSICTQYGGNLFDVIRSANSVLSEKRQMEREVSVLIAEKKLEQNAMSLMPIAILLLFQNSAPEFISPLYTTVIGRICMTFLLAIYTISFFWAKRLADIR